MARQVKINCLIYIMKILLISKDARIGGAAVAARRLLEALKDRQVDANLLVQERGEPGSSVFDTTATTVKRWANKSRFILERITYLPHERDRSVRFMFSPANTGEDLSGNRLLKEADIIHLQWINGGFLSIRSLEKLFSLGKPVVWTFHDIWAVTGGCHLAMDCTEYMQNCGNCPYLRNPHKGDLSSRIWKRKSKLFRNLQFTIVTPSQWLKECVASSSLLGHCEIRAIHNPVNPDLFRPVERETACRNLGLDPGKKYILFGSANVRNMIKGFGYFVEAIRILHGEMHGDPTVEILLLGRTKGDEAGLFPFRTRSISFTDSSRKVVEIFSAAHLYAISSLQENFPNTIVESMLCGTPAVGFRTGGIPEMISHMEDGYLAEHRSAPDLAEGMKWLLNHSDYTLLSERTREAALNRFSYEKAVKEYMKVYRGLIKPDARS
jgi:glycosyltransferase involved in cell wall biosynthesis